MFTIFLFLLIFRNSVDSSRSNFTTHCYERNRWLTIQICFRKTLIHRFKFKSWICMMRIELHATFSLVDVCNFGLLLIFSTITTQIKTITNTAQYNEEKQWWAHNSHLEILLAINWLYKPLEIVKFIKIVLVFGICPVFKRISCIITIKLWNSSNNKINTLIYFKLISHLDCAIIWNKIFRHVTYVASSVEINIYSLFNFSKFNINVTRKIIHCWISDIIIAHAIIWILPLVRGVPQIIECKSLFFCWGFYH